MLEVDISDAQMLNVFFFDTRNLHAPFMGISCFQPSWTMEQTIGHVAIYREGWEWNFMIPNEGKGFQRIAIGCQLWFSGIGLEVTVGVPMSPTLRNQYKNIQEWCQHVQFQVNIQSPYYMATWCDMAIPLLDGPSVAGIARSKTLGPKFPQFQARSLALTVKPHSISSPTDQAVPDLGLMRMAEKFGYFYPF